MCVLIGASFGALTTNEVYRFGSHLSCAGTFFNEHVGKGEYANCTYKYYTSATHENPQDSQGYYYTATAMDEFSGKSEYTHDINRSYLISVVPDASYGMLCIKDHPSSNESKNCDWKYTWTLYNTTTYNVTLICSQPDIYKALEDNAEQYANAHSSKGSYAAIILGMMVGGGLCARRQSPRLLNQAIPPQIALPPIGAAALSSDVVKVDILPPNALHDSLKKSDENQPLLSKEVEHKGVGSIKKGYGSLR